jgi:hypothetical protein
VGGGQQSVSTGPNVSGIVKVASANRSISASPDSPMQ